MTVRINKQKINLREKLAGVEEKVNFDEVVRGLGEYGGNVGIGTTNPAALLHIRSTSFGDTGIIIENTNNAQNLDIDFYGNSGAGFVGAAQGRIRYQEGAGSIEINPNVATDAPFKILYDGNVGIGTTSPGIRLHVPNFYQYGDSNNGSAKLGNIRFDISGTMAEGLHYFGTGLWKAEGTEGSIIQQADGRIVFLTDANLTEGNTHTPTERMRITSDGKVGIGAADPGAKLDVNDNTVTDNAWNVLAKFRPDVNDSPAEPGIHIQSFPSTTTPVDRRAGIQSVDDTGQVRSLLLNKDGGNVGIGITNPGSYKLYVNGNAFSSGTWGTSDDRVKHNEQPIIGALETLSKITPKKYIKTTEMYDANHDFELDAEGNPVDSNGEPVEHTIEAGVIAQQVLTVDELAFAVSPEGVDEDGAVTSPHGLDYNSLFTYAIAAIQEQQQLINDLKSRIETLEQQ